MNDVFEPQARAIYRYNNGEKVVAADPLVLRGNLSKLALMRGKSLAAFISAANGVDVANASDIENAEAWDALQALAEIAIDGFALIPFNAETGAGCDMAHALGVLNHFHLWCEKKNQKPASPPTSMPPSESISATPPTTATSSV